MNRSATTARFALVTVLVATVGLAACESESTGPENQLVQGEIAIDASDHVSFAFFTFADGGSALPVTDPATSTDWHIGLRRFSAKLNGGVAGPGTVEGANLGNNATATDVEVTAFSQADADAAWDAVTDADIAGATFVTDGLIADNSGPWFTFSPIAGTLVANPGAAWKIREADGGFAVFRVSNLVMAGMAAQTVTIEYRRHDAGGTLGTAGTVDVDVTTGPGFVDLQSGATVTPMGGCGWDLSVAPSFMIEMNAACNAGTFPLDAAEDFSTIPNADDAPDYGAFLSTISGALPTTVDDAGGVFWYNIQGNNRLWPTYNVFLVRVGTAVYKVQITDYYDASGTPGHVTIRYEQLQ